MFKVNNRNTRTRCEICSKLTIKVPERRRTVRLHPPSKDEGLKDIGHKLKVLLDIRKYNFESQ